MGEARRRGPRELRVANAITRDKIEREREEADERARIALRDQVRAQHLRSLTPEKRKEEMLKRDRAMLIGTGPAATEALLMALLASAAWRRR